MKSMERVMTMFGTELGLESVLALGAQGNWKEKMKRLGLLWILWIMLKVRNPPRR